MDKEYIDWLEKNRNKFSNEQIHDINSYLKLFTKEHFEILKDTKLKKPEATVLLSVLFGLYGIDRFYLGEIFTGLIKMFTFGGFGIMYLVDIFTCKKRVYVYNYNKVMEIIYPQQFDNSKSDLNNATSLLKNMTQAAKSVSKSAKNVQDTFYTE